MNVAAKADDVAEAEAFEEFEQFDVAEAAIGQDRHRHALGQDRLQMRQAEVFEVVALVLQFVLVDRQPQERRRPAVARDQAQSERGLIVGVEIGPIHRHDDRLAPAHDLARLWREQVHTTIPALLSRRSTCLIACLSARPRACASACPITETANDAPVRTPSVPLASELLPLILASVASRKAFRSARIGAERRCRASRRSAGPRPRMSASTANSRAILSSASRAAGEPVSKRRRKFCAGRGPNTRLRSGGNAGLRLGFVRSAKPAYPSACRKPPTAGEQRPRVLGLAVGRIAIEGSARRRRAERALVAHHGPQPAGLGLAFAGIEPGTGVSSACSARPARTWRSILSLKGSRSPARRPTSPP